ncbi:MAG: ComF family protein [Burkholderiaceae bacterium]|nr:ComF family protein [Burkholderiaceae bacterium]
MLSRLHQWSQHVWARLPAVLPSSCALCGMSGEHAICNACRARYFQRRAQSCCQCAMPLAIDSPVALRCGACLHQPPAFDATFAAVDYEAPVDQLVLALKFGSRLALAPTFARLMRDSLLLAAPQPALPGILLPVPLGAARLSQRGFNQALEIARPLSRALGIKLEPRLALRLRDTSAQATLHPEQRRKNIRNAFMISHEYVDRLHGQHVGVVDDVMTTGETLNELAATLKRFGAARVTNFVFARTLLK